MKVGKELVCDTLFSGAGPFLARLDLLFLGFRRDANYTQVLTLEKQPKKHQASSGVPTDHLSVSRDSGGSVIPGMYLFRIGNTMSLAKRACRRRRCNVYLNHFRGEHVGGQNGSPKQVPSPGSVVDPV